MDADECLSSTDKLDPLQKQLLQVLKEQNLSSQRELLQAISFGLNVSILDCAAALLYLKQQSGLLSAKAVVNPSKEALKSHYRFVRYRLDIGSQHHVAKEQIQAVLIEESGVDKNRIGKIDIRHNYTLVELPDGMPADIFQLLSEATIGERKLAIKRVKPNRRSGKDKTS